jgi:hypothetical protein
VSASSSNDTRRGVWVPGQARDDDRNETTARYSVTAFSEICQSLPSKIEMCSVFIGE